MDDRDEDVRQSARRPIRGELRVLCDDHVVVRRARGPHIEGWAMDRSDGGLRAMLDRCVWPGEELVVIVGREPPAVARVAWVRLEAGGVIMGLMWMAKRAA